ncbi:MAG TPA: protein kinase [Chthoniobacteraceae bacterium]|nr:protein kinase [Chthoniobacteraceae bacterium]
MPETVSFEHYEVLTRDDGSLYELGRGAMGVTYKAFDTSLRVTVALKVINAAYLNSEVARQRFIREAQSAAKLRHRNVATVYHLGMENDAWFYAMEFIDGETVDALVKRHGPLEPVLALQIAAQVARALNAAVPHALVHRDIKPANLMLVREDEELVVKVIDFGLALSAADEETATASFVGTPHFASPEQLKNEDLDVRSDIYSLGVTLWLMLAGRTPFAGTVEQVKKLHLTQAPPFEQFKELPEPVVAILRKALEKDAAKRHQTPQEFRRAVEECIEQISGAGAQAAQEEELTSLLDEAQQRPGETQFEPHAVIAGRFKLIEPTGETNTGRTFRAYDRERQRDVRMLVLRAELEGAAYTQIEREVEKIAQVHHENLLEFHDFEMIDGASFLVMEWTEGFSVLELLRARRELEASETLALLQHAARGADHALSAGLKCIDFALHAIAIHFAQSVDKEKLLHAPLLTWPAFTVKLNPLGVTHEITASETWAGGQTMVQSAPAAGPAMSDRARYVQALGAVAYELLGGSISPLQVSGVSFDTMAAHYTPLSTLSEEGNEVLKRALNPAESFASAQEFFEALKNLEVLGVRPAQPKPPVASAIRSPASAELSHRTRTTTTHTTKAAPKKKKLPVKFLGGLLTVTAIGAGIYLVAPHESPKTAGDSPRETPQHFSDTPEVTPTPSETQPAAVPPAPSPETKPEPAAAAPAPVVNEREEKLRAALAAASAAEERGDPAEAIASWLRAARDFPESDAPRKRLDFVIDPLRKRPEIKKQAFFDTLKPLLVEAAQLDSLSAVLLLAEAERSRNVRESFAWYSTAAATGRPEAYLQMGLLLSNGIDGAPELEKAYYYFNLAAESNDVDAKTALAECHLFGKGTPKDFEHGVKWLKEAADQGNLRAMNRLADGYDHGNFNLPVNYDEAFRLWSKVIELKNPTGDNRQPVGEAFGNLGVLYINGHGTTLDETRAVKLFTEGVRLGDGNSMFLLGLCTQDGRGGLAKNATEAQRLIKRGAEAGSKAAQGWCRNNGVIYGAK